MKYNKIVISLVLACLLFREILSVNWMNDPRKCNAHDVYHRSRNILLQRFQRGKTSLESRKRFAKRLCRRDPYYQQRNINMRSLAQIIAHAKRRFDGYGQI